VTYTKKHLPDVEDSALRYGLSDTQVARFARRDLAAEQTGVTYLIIKPGCREAFAHRHREAEEIYVVLALELLIFGTHVDGDVEQVSGFWTS
jgi:uncharacterized cupin superfamily protein